MSYGASTTDFNGCSIDPERLLGQESWQQSMASWTNVQSMNSMQAIGRAEALLMMLQFGQMASGSSEASIAASTFHGISKRISYHKYQHAMS